MSRVDYSECRTILDGIKMHAGSDKAAVLSKDGEVSYRELIRDALRIVAALQAEGIGKGCFVILDMKRSADMIKGLLGILYAGAAYVAVDSDWPDERLKYIYDDCGAACRLKEDTCAELLSKGREYENCGGRLPESGNFCPNCGNKI